MAIDKKKKDAVKTVVKITDAEEKKKALDTAIAYIEKQFGKGAIMKLGEAKAMDIEAIPTGSMTLDMALGIGGVPRGRIIEIYGPESSGKTTVALHVIAETQKMGGEVAFIDVELLTLFMQVSLALISTICLFLSLTAVSRLWR